MTRLSGSPEYCRLKLELEVGAGKVIDLDWSVDGRLLAAACDDGGVRIFNLKKNSAKFSFRHGPALRTVTWSYDSRYLASSGTNTIRLWNAQLGELRDEIMKDTGIEILCSSWAPVDGGSLAFSTLDNRVYIWNPLLGNTTLQKLTGHAYAVSCLAWARDGKVLATGTCGGTIGIWRDHAVDHQLRLHYHNHHSKVRCLAWHPDNHTLASGSNDCNIHIINTQNNILSKTIDMQQEPVVGLAFDNSGKFLIAKSFDDTIRIWHTKDYTLVRELNEGCDLDFSLLASNPVQDLIATRSDSSTSIPIWHIDFAALDREKDWEKHPYRIAKAIVFGECDGMKQKALKVLSRLPECEYYDSKRLSLGRSEISCDVSTCEIAEVVLWDELEDLSFTAFELIRIRDASLVILVLNAADLSDKNEQILVSHVSIELAKKCAIPVMYVVVDEHGHNEFHRQDIMSWFHSLGISKVQWLSLANPKSVAGLHDAIFGYVRWDRQKRVPSLAFYLSVENFYEQEKQNNVLIHHADTSYERFFDCVASFSPAAISKEQFTHCLNSLENAGRVHLFSNNETVFLQPSATHAYVEGMYATACEDDLEMGRLEEISMTRVDFPVDQEHRLTNAHQEQLLIMAITAMLQESGLAYKVSTSMGSYWVFPSALKRQAVLAERRFVDHKEFSLEGALKDAYSFIVTRLAGSAIFRNPELWENLALFHSAKQEKCGLQFVDEENGRGMFRLVFDSDTSPATRDSFANFVRLQLEMAPSISSVLEINSETNLHTQKPSDGNKVFICYNSLDLQYVRHIEGELRKRQINVWYDEHMAPGDSVLTELERQITAASTILMLLGANGLGRWQNQEYQAVISKAVGRGGRVIPGLLPKYNEDVGKPLFLEGYKHVDFRLVDPEPIGEIVRVMSKQPSTSNVD